MALPPQTDSGAHAAPTGPWRWAMLGGVAMIYYAFGITMASMAPLVHQVSADLGMDNAQMGTVLGAWALVYIFTSVPCGAFLDRIGPRRALLIATTIIAVSQIMRGTAQGPVSLFLAVAVFGIGGPLVSSGAPKVISQWFQGADRGMAIGIYFTGNTLGVITALTLTNSVMVPLYDGDWRSVLFTYAAVTFSAGLVWFFMAGHPQSRAMERYEASVRTGTSLDGFLGLIRRPTVQIVLVMSVGILFFNHSLNNWLPEILRTSGMTAVEAGYWAALPVMIGIGAALTIPRMATAERRFPILFCLILSACLATLLINFGGEYGVPVGLVLSGLARGTLSSIAVLTLMDSEGGRSGHVGQASGLYFSAGEIGGMLGPLSVGFVSNATGGFTAPLLMLTADTVILLMLTVAMWRITRLG
jgi:CP family cyanate transporter-like MFS transporter